MRADRGVHLHRHLGPCLAGQRDQPIDPCGLAARIALRDLAHAYQRVMPAAQHQLLQVHGRGHVPFLHRLEDPASQPPYLLLAAPPVHMLPGVAVESREYRPGVLRSVHRGVQLILWFRHLLPFHFKDSPAHVSVLSNPSTGSVSGQLYKDHPGGVPGPAAPDFLLLFSCRHSLFEHPVLPGNSAPLTVGLPHRLRIPAPEMRTHGTVSTFRTRETQTGPGALCTPGTAVLTRPRSIRGRRLPLLNGSSLPPRRHNPARNVNLTRHQQEFPGSRPIPVLPLTCGHHGWSSGPWAFP